MKYVVYRETKPGIARPLLEIVVQRGIYNLQLRLATEKANKNPSDYLASISGLISGFDDDAHSAVVGFVFDATDLDNFNQFSAWAFKHLLDALLPGTWDMNYKGETTLNGFKSDFRLQPNAIVKPLSSEEILAQPSTSETEPIEAAIKPKRPTSVSVISWILITFSSITLILAVIIKMKPSSSVTTGPAVPFFLLVIISCINITSGSFMLQGKNWARILFVINAIGLISASAFILGMQALFGTIMLGFFVYMLTRFEEDKYFRPSKP